MRKFLILIGLVIFTVSCTSTSEKSVEEDRVVSEEKSLSIQAILDSNKLNGSVLILDDSLHKFYSNNFEWSKKSQLPASTFKIPNSIIGLESGVVNDSTIFKWDGEKRFLKSWEEDLNLAQAFKRSCVPCYQEVARGVGVDNMKEWLNKIGYTGMVVTPDSIDTFWLTGNSRISPLEQIHFLRKLDKKQLPISSKTYAKMRDIMLLETGLNYELRAKTGWSQDGKENGWFVGYLEIEGKTYYFATNVEPKADFDMSNFGKIRSIVTKESLSVLGIL
ncbi:beta-lactamase class D [Spirosomataceae bacterium TFI 002]|nr:beta-lactamase class D [Spirosomataceae bacterium TFI 002]